MSNPIGVSVLGATGSIGASALDVIRMHPDRFKVVGLSAWRQADALASLVSEFSPSVVAAAPEVLAGFPSEANGGCAGAAYCSGAGGLNSIASHPDVVTVVAGISGAAGLESIFSAVKSEYVLDESKEGATKIFKQINDQVPALASFFSTPSSLTFLTGLTTGFPLRSSIVSIFFNK